MLRKQKSARLSSWPFWIFQRWVVNVHVKMILCYEDQVSLSQLCKRLFQLKKTRIANIFSKERQFLTLLFFFFDLRAKLPSAGLSKRAKTDPRTFFAILGRGDNSLLTYQCFPVACAAFHPKEWHNHFQSPCMSDSLSVGQSARYTLFFSALIYNFYATLSAPQATWVVVSGLVCESFVYFWNLFSRTLTLITSLSYRKLPRATLRSNIHQMLGTGIEGNLHDCDGRPNLRSIIARDASLLLECGAKMLRIKSNLQVLGILGELQGDWGAERDDTARVWRILIS